MILTRISMQEEERKGAEEEGQRAAEEERVGEEAWRWEEEADPIYNHIHL